MSIYTVAYRNAPEGYLHHWNCKDSEVEAFRVYGYYKNVCKYVAMWKDKNIIHEYKYYDEGVEES